MSWNDKTNLVPNTFAGRPNPSDTSETYRVRASTVNENFVACALATGVTQALGMTCTDAGSSSTACRLTLPAGVAAPGDLVVALEDRPTCRSWATTAGVGGTIEFGDSELHDAGKAGTTDYDTLKNDLLLLVAAPLCQPWIPYGAILRGGVHGLKGSHLPWDDSTTLPIPKTIKTKFEELEAAIGALNGPGGEDGSVQFNEASTFGGDNVLKYHKAFTALTLGASILLSGNGRNLAVGDGHIISGEKSAVIGDAITSQTTAGLCVGESHSAAGNNSVLIGVGAADLATGGQQDNRAGFYQAGGYENTVGDSQASRFVLYGTTDYNGILEQDIYLRDNRTYGYQALIVARATDGTGSSATWRLAGCCEQTAQAGSRDVPAGNPPTATLIKADTGVGWEAVSIVSSAESAPERLRFSIHNSYQTPVPVRWTILVELVEVAAKAQ